jgi:hypothetical protein
MYQRSSYSSCINIYNKLPDDLAYLITKKKQFLLELKKHLITKPYYSLEEFLNTEQIWDEYQYNYGTKQETEQSKTERNVINLNFIDCSLS